MSNSVNLYMMIHHNVSAFSLRYITKQTYEGEATGFEFRELGIGM